MHRGLQQALLGIAALAFCPRERSASVILERRR